VLEERLRVLPAGGEKVPRVGKGNGAGRGHVAPRALEHVREDGCIEDDAPTGIDDEAAVSQVGQQRRRRDPVGGGAGTALADASQEGFDLPLLRGR